MSVVALLLDVLWSVGPRLFVLVPIAELSMEAGGSGLRVVSDAARLATHVVDSAAQRSASPAPGGSEGDVRCTSEMLRPASAGFTQFDLDGVCVRQDRVCEGADLELNDSRWTMSACLGRGHFGVVWQAIDAHSGVVRAVKSVDHADFASF